MVGLGVKKRTIIGQFDRYFCRQTGIDKLPCEGYVGTRGVGETSSRGGDGKDDFLVSAGKDDLCIHLSPMPRCIHTRIIRTVNRPCMMILRATSRGVRRLWEAAGRVKICIG